MVASLLEAGDGHLRQVPIEPESPTTRGHADDLCESFLDTLWHGTNTGVRDLASALTHALAVKSP